MFNAEYESIKKTQPKNIYLLIHYHFYVLPFNQYLLLKMYTRSKENEGGLILEFRIKI